jgi:hypothetical protein
MADANPITFGSKQMLVNSATAQFPTNGRGGSQGTAHANFPATGDYVVEGITVQVVAGAANAVNILAGDGTTQLCTIPLTTAMVAGTYVPIGGVNGYESTPSALGVGGPGISATLSNTTGSPSVTLWFRRIG